jgi:hypothetical protein
MISDDARAHWGEESAWRRCSMKVGRSEACEARPDSSIHVTMATLQNLIRRHDLYITAHLVGMYIGPFSILLLAHTCSRRSVAAACHSPPILFSV